MSSASQGVVSAGSSVHARTSREPIAVVGVSALMPGSSDATGYWRDCFEGNDRITDVPESHWLISDYYDADPTKPDKTYAKRGAFLSPIDFDPMEFGVPPSIVPATDTSQLLALVCAKRLLDDVAAGNLAGIDASKLDRSRMSVILGATSAQELVNQMASRLQKPIWVKALREQGLPEDEVQSICDRISNEYTPWQESTFPGLLGNVIAGRIANRLDLGGTNCVTDAACASSFSALQMAISELHLGDSDVALCGGVETLNDIFMFMCFSKTPALSLSGDIRPFSDKADGTMLGEGIALVALKRLSDAEKQGDRIYAVIKAIGTSSDGRAKSVYAPVPEGQAKSLRRAYQNAGYGPETVELVEGHGTGTKAGDAAELEGLRTVWGESDRAKTEKQWCALGTVKAQVGHTKACAGAAGLLKAIFALHHKVLPPTIKVDAPNAAMKIDETAFYLNTAARPWVRSSDHPRRASVSSFGFGGSNFHVALEEYVREDRRRERLRAMPSELVVVLGSDGADVARQCRAMAKECARDGMLLWFAHQSQVALGDAGGAGKKARLAIVATNEADLAKKLGDAATKLEATPSTSFSMPSGVDYALGSEPGKVAFLFPGQGSQYVGMGADVAMAFDEAQAVLDRAADHRFDGVSVPSTIFPKPVFTDAARAAQGEMLTRTEWAQPAIGVTSESLLVLTKSMSLTPDVVGGHSFGEVTALFAAGAIGEEGLLEVARLRGERMADAASTTKGAMAAVPRTIEEVRTIIAALPKDLADAVVVANHNGPKQVVVSGATDAIDALVARLIERGINAKRLPVATAFHSPIVAGSSAPFRAALTKIAIASPKIPVFSNADAAPYATSPDAIRDTLAQQIAKPVRFVEQVRAMHAMGVRTFIEVGPHAVLTSLVDECLSDQAPGSFRAIAMDRKGKNGVTALWSALGKLVVAGVKVDVAALWDRYRTPTDPRTKKKPPMTLALSGTNYGKPYPPKGGEASLPKPNGPRVKPEPEIVVKEVIKEVVKEVVREVPVAASGSRESVAMASPVSDAWSEVQRQTADAHATYLKAMADSHGRFLQVAEQAIAALSGQVPSAQASAFASAPRAIAPSYASSSTPTRSPERQAATSIEPVVAPSRPAVVARAPTSAPVVAAPFVVAPAVTTALDLKPIMLSVVSEKTGYPAEMLTMEMALEADLGIDSIKRVEILSAMKERVPTLPAFKASDMGALRTLGEIVSFMEANGGATITTTTASSTATSTASSTATTTATASLDLRPIMLAVVSEKTGYPAEMLTMEMALEADLGIDSIKRVEILSAMKDRVPNLPAFKASDMAALRTLGEIVGFMEANGGGAIATATPTVTATTTPTATLDLKPIMLSVVSDKTGYPAEMLTMEMALEADLGIDSIKRVEILSAMKDRVPNLPAFKAADMAALRTLGEIVAFMEKSGG
ncbi:MAG: beta-ketoacyl synthase N-terminal-like domain-containing protein, partial [Polyangiales bacterium]